MPDPIPCPHCNYDLRGNPTYTCPECGFGFDEETLHTIERKRRFERDWLEASLQVLWWLPCAIIVIAAAAIISFATPPTWLRPFALGRLTRGEGLCAWPVLFGIIIAGRLEYNERFARSPWRRYTRTAVAIATAVEAAATLTALLL